MQDENIDLKNKPFFEMDYAYFSLINERMICFTTDYGLVGIELSNFHK